MDRRWLQAELEKYQHKYAGEAKIVSRFLDLLFCRDCFDRFFLPAHITASAWALTPDLSQVVLLHHKKLNKWLQPGGHADGDENVLRVAKKELCEEAGITDTEVIGDSFFDLDIHVIPAHGNMAIHEHFDVRFAMIANDPSQLRKNDESHEVSWVSLDQLEQFIENEPSIVRMKEKTILL